MPVVQRTSRLTVQPPPPEELLMHMPSEHDLACVESYPVRAVERTHGGAPGGLARPG